MTAVFVGVGTGDTSAVGEARRTASRLAESAGFGEMEVGKAAIVATELATNLVRHSTGGELLVQSVQSGGRKWLELFSIDRGPGIENVERCLRDGYSTAGTPGTGLGAVRRMSTEFDLHSAVPTGTVVYCRLAPACQPTAPDEGTFRWSAVSKPAPHETCCGDAWSVAERGDDLALLLADGLGHGPEAEASALKATAAFEENPFAPLTTIIQNANMRLSGMRGAALAVARIEGRARSMRYAGVGNIAGHLRKVDEERGRGLCSHSGTVGVQIRKIQEFDYECPGQSFLVMHSDGLQSRWDLQAYPGITRRHPGVAAAILYRDFVRGRDDVTVVVASLSLA